MPEGERFEDHLYCSFCGKNESEVKKLIAGPMMFICDECIGLCNDILSENKIESVAPARIEFDGRALYNLLRSLSALQQIALRLNREGLMDEEFRAEVRNLSERFQAFNRSALRLVSSK